MLKWKLDADAVAELELMGIAWSERTIPASEIDAVGSRENGARADAIIADNVADYEEAMRAGDVFPCIVVCRIGTDTKYTIAGGNHRHEAATRIGEQSFPVICCNVELLEFTHIAARLNRRNGQRESRKHRLVVAARSVLQNGMTRKDAAALHGLSQTAVQAEIQCREVSKSLSAVNRDASKLKQSTLVTLSRLKTDTELLPIAFDIACAGVTGDALNALLRKAKSLGTAQERVDFLNGHLQQQAKRKTMRGVSSTPIATMFRAGLTKITHSVERGAECQLQMDAAEITQAAAALDHLARVVNQMATSAR